MDVNAIRPAPTSRNPPNPQSAIIHWQRCIQLRVVPYSYATHGLIEILKKAKPSKRRKILILVYGVLVVVVLYMASTIRSAW